MISIVIPVLNEDIYIIDCLSSLKQQDYTGDYEIIVVDNGSSDNTVVLARSFGAGIVSCPERRGVFHVRTVGAEAARGDIIVQVDADTIYPLDWLSRIARHFEEHPEVVAVTGRFFYTRKQWFAPAESWVRHSINRITTAIVGRPLFVSGATFAFRRNAFYEKGGYSGLTYSADQYGIARRLSKAGKVIYDPDIYVFTSPRRVAGKTIPRLAADITVNVTNFGLHIAGTFCASIAVAMQKTPQRRLAFRLSPMVILPLLVVSYGYFVPASPVFGEVYYEVDTPHKVLALTFDDGPNEPYTSQILEILDRYNVKATFFLIGQNVEAYPRTAERILEEGHVIGNHSYSHQPFHALSEQGADDLRQEQQLLSNKLGIVPHLYRPPNGRKTPWEIQSVKDEGMIEVTWSVSTNETFVRSASHLAKNIINETDPGEIILLHDGHETEFGIEKADKSLVVQALPLIIEQLQADGYTFVTVPQLLNVPAYND